MLDCVRSLCIIPKIFVIGSEKRYLFRKIMKIELLIPGCSKFIGELNEASPIVIPLTKLELHPLKDHLL